MVRGAGRVVDVAATMSGASRVLVVDDEAAGRYELIERLERAGHEVQRTQGADDALEAILADAPELVICRLSERSHDGFDLLEALQARKADVPVIVLSSGGDMDEVVRALRLGAADYLVEAGLEDHVLYHAIEREIASMKLRRENARYRRELETVNENLREYLDELRQDQQAGRQVQMGMLPPSPMALDGYRLQHRILPSLYLSGDFVDYFPVTDRHFVFYMADVSGHGASSAFVTVLLKNFSRRLRREYRPRMLLAPGDILRWLNQELIESRLDRHVALFIGVVDGQENEVRYANAGHFPAPVLAGDGVPKLLELKGKPLGLFPDQRFESASEALPERFVLALFSDGVLDVLNDAELSAREARLMNAVATAGADMDGICERLGLYEGMEAPDDVACLLISRW